MSRQEDYDKYSNGCSFPEKPGFFLLKIIKQTTDGARLNFEEKKRKRIFFLLGMTFIINTIELTFFVSSQYHWNIV